MKDIEKIEALQKRAAMSSVNLPMKVCKIDEDKRLVFGEVYAPNIIDSHGDMMLDEDVELLAHRFMADGKQAMVDVMHNNVVIDALVVESFIARGHPDYNEGAWVAITKVHDDDVWTAIKAGVYNGYSMEVYVKKQKALVEIEIEPSVFGYTEKNTGHDHAFIVEVDDSGKVIGGRTSIDNGHMHVIRLGTATDETDGHSHRYFLP